MLSEVGTDMHTQKKAAESFHCEITPQIPLTIFVSRKYVHEGRAQRTRAILAETGAGAETEVRLRSHRSVAGFLVSILWPWGSASRALCPQEGQCSYL